MLNFKLIALTVLNRYCHYLFTQQNQSFQSVGVREHSTRFIVSKEKQSNTLYIRVMKKFYLLSVALLTLLLSANYVNAQEFGEQSTMTRQEARKAARAAHKKAMEAQQQQMFEEAVQCLKDGSFVIEVDQLVFPKGLTKFVSSLTNFVSMNEGKAVIQIATSSFSPGLNGVGGISVEGDVSNITMSTSKRGIVYYNFLDQGVAVSATVNIQLTGDGNRATVTVYPNFNNNNLTMTGNLVPYDQSHVFQGQTF